MSKLSDFVGGDGIISKYEEFTTSGTWTKDPDAKWVYVECIGGGGGGASIVGSNGPASGGSGGESVSKLWRASEIPENITITVGSGGDGGPVGGSGYANGGGDGGQSVFYEIYAPGGYGGFTNTEGIFASAAGSKSRDAPFTAYDYVPLRYSGHGGGLDGVNLSRLNGGSTYYGGAGGGSAYNYGENKMGLGGTSYFGGKGGDGSTFEPSHGEFPGGGGGGSHNSTPGGNGGDGVVRIWQW